MCSHMHECSHHQWWWKLRLVNCRVEMFGVQCGLRWIHLISTISFEWFHWPARIKDSILKEPTSDGKSTYYYFCHFCMVSVLLFTPSQSVKQTMYFSINHHHHQCIQGVLSRINTKQRNRTKRMNVVKSSVEIMANKHKKESNCR